MKAETITGVNALPLEEEMEEIKGKAEKKSGKRIGYNYIIVRSLKEHKKNDVVKCLYIKSLTKWGFCVIKEGTFGDTKDKHGRDIRDRLIWQKELHEQLQDKIRLPRYYGSFEENGNYYLVMEYIKGKSLGSMLRREGRKLREQLIHGGKSGEKFLGYLIQITELLITLHKEGVVHRDATAGNFLVTKSGKVAVIDMELSYSLNMEFPTPPFELGTTGYMSVKQERVHTPTTDEDIFAIAAIILQVWTGVSPSKLTRPPANELADRVRFFIPDGKLSNLVINCLKTETTERCTLDQLKTELSLYLTELKGKKQRVKAETKIFSNDEILQIVQQGIATLCSPLMADPVKGWFAQNQQTINEDKNKIDKEYYASIQFGTAGVMYFICQASKVGLNVDEALPHIQSGLRLIEKKYISRGESSAPGFYFGAAGVGVVLQKLREQGLILEDVFTDWSRHLLQRSNQEWGVLNGRAGHGMALLQTASIWEEPELRNLIDQDVSFLLSLQQEDGAWVYPDPKKKKKPQVLYSFLNGISGTAYFLLDYAHRFKDSTALAKAELSLNLLMKKSSVYEGRTIWKSNSGKRLGFAWCEGNSGIALSFIKAFEVTGKSLYKDFAVKILQGIKPGILDNSLCQCHGVAGLGEVYIEAYRVFRDEVWLQRAAEIVQFLLNTRMKNNKGLYWLVEQERQPVPAFMIGNSGVMHFMIRYLYPDLLSFPFLGQDPVSEKMQPLKTNDPDIKIQPLIV